MTARPDTLPALPTRSSEVDAQFLTRALRAGGCLGPSGEVADVAKEPFAAGVGLSGQLTVLHLRYCGAGAATAGAPPTLVLKLPAEAEENRVVNRQFGMYVREGRFYAQLAATMPVRKPHCLFAAVDLEQQTSLILMENLRAWRPGCQVTGASLSEAERAMDTAAALHAAAWDRPPGADDGWLEPFDGGVFIATGPAYRAVWPAFLDRFGHLLPPGSAELGLRTQEVFEDLQRAATAQAPSALVHGDFRLDNMMFADDPAERGEMALLDWQLPHRGPAAEDLAMFLCQSLPVDLRRRHEAALVRRWHAALARGAARANRRGCGRVPHRARVRPLPPDGALRDPLPRHRRRHDGHRQRAWAGAQHRHGRPLVHRRHRPGRGRVPAPTGGRSCTRPCLTHARPAGSAARPYRGFTD